MVPRPRRTQAEAPDGASAIVSADPHADAADETLVGRSRCGDEGAVAQLLGRYRPVVADIARRYFLAGGDRNDVIQEGMIGLYRAVSRFDAATGVPFRAFANLCVRHSIQNAVQASLRNKHSPLNASLSLSSTPEADAGLSGWKATASAHDPAEIVALRDEHERLARFLTSVLTPLERDVLTSYLAGATYDAIAADVDRSSKAVDNALQRIRRKVEQRYLPLAA